MSDRAFDTPADLRYSKEHEWLRLEADTARVGITDYAQDSLGDVVYVDLPKVGDLVKSQAKMAEIESVKVVSEIFAPASGEVIAVNEALADAPEAVNNDPYGAGWLAVIRLSDPSEVDRLLTPEAYAELVQRENEGADR